MTVRIINADVMSALRHLPDESVHCVVTSPPYYALRDYQTATWEDGDPNCAHERVNGTRTPWANAVPGPNGLAKNTAAGHWKPKQIGGECSKCGAIMVDYQIGLEDTPEAFVTKMVEVFREVRRVLRKDGTCWINMGDCYNAARNGGHAGGKGALNAGRDLDAIYQGKSGANVPGLKAKDLVGMPWRVAFALQADGWWLRSDIIWHKPNPMPESVTDRPTKSHEYVFLLTRSERYFYDAEAIKEDSIYGGDLKKTNGNAGMDAGYDGHRTRDGFARGVVVPALRNKRSVWTIATSPFPEAHFATFPPELPEICIKAGTSQHGCCAKCGTPWERELEKEATGKIRERKTAGLGTAIRREPLGLAPVAGVFQEGVVYRTVGWSPSCSCNAAVVPATILDPFAGAGTTCLVADRLQRNAIGIELNSEYAAMAERRLSRDRGGLLDLMEAAE